MGSILKKYEKISRSRVGTDKSQAKAIKWFRETIYKLPISRKRLLNDDRVKVRTGFLPGRLYCFIYDPKHKKTLPYYDRFPLTVLVDELPDGNGFYGLNLHYLAPLSRAKLLDALMDHTKGKNENTRRFNITYNFIKKAAKFRLFRPCFKTYLYSHIRSKMVEVRSPDWETATFLPIEHFAKKKKQAVWAESMRKI